MLQVNYYFYNYFVPSGLFVVVSWVSFVIPPDSVPGRIALIITTLLVLVNIANTVFAVSPAADVINSLQVRTHSIKVESESGLYILIQMISVYFCEQHSRVHNYMSKFF